MLQCTVLVLGIQKLPIIFLQVSGRYLHECVRHIQRCCTKMLYPTSRRITISHQRTHWSAQQNRLFLFCLSQEQVIHINLTCSFFQMRHNFRSCWVMLFVCPSLRRSAHLLCFTEYVCKIAKLNKPLLIHQDICLIRLLVTQNENSFLQTK